MTTAVKLNVHVPYNVTTL